MFKLSLKILLSLLFCPFIVESYPIDQMTLEEKVGQLFMAYFDGEEANEHAERLIKETKIGGYHYQLQMPLRQLHQEIGAPQEPLAW